MNITTGIFISDIHFPWNIDIKPVLSFLSDYKPSEIILGGDIIDADGTHGIDGWTADQVEKSLFKFYNRDIETLRNFILSIKRLSPKSKIVYLEGNHEERYRRPRKRYPELMKGKCDIEQDIKPLINKWIKYGDYASYYKVGDMIFMHGTIYPDSHAKKMAMCYLPNKVLYGHIHDFQAYTTHNGDPTKPGRYAVTSGCLCGRLPDYKQGQPNKWINGFATWISVNGVTTATPIIVEKWGFSIGGKVYGN